MPTITTTVDSGTGFNTTFTAQSSSDVATTASTSGTDQLPQGPDFFHGRMMTVQLYTFQNAEDKASFVFEMQPIVTAIRNHGHPDNFMYIVDTGALTFTCIMMCDGTDSFLQCEALFAANKTIQAMLGSFSGDAHFIGDIGDAVQAKIDLWNQAPGLNCTTRQCEFTGKLIGTEMGSTGIGLIRKCALATKEQLDESMAKFRFVTPATNDCFPTNVAIRTSDTEYIGVWLSDTPSGLEQWIDTLKHPDVAPVLGDALGQHTEFGGQWFGNIGDEKSQELMAAWPMFPAAKMLCGSLGGDNIGSIQRWSYSTKAARDAFLRVMDNVRGFQGQALWCGWPAGDVTLYVLIFASSTEACREMQAVIGGNAEIMEHLTKTELVNLSHYDFGNVQAGWASDIAGWREAIPALRPDPNAHLICSVDAGPGSNYHSSGITWTQEAVYNNAGDPEKMADMFSSGELYEKLREAGGNFNINKMGPARSLNMFNFPSDTAWLKYNETLAKYAPQFTELMKDLQCFGIGNVHGAAVGATVAEWNKAPWCNVVLQARVSGVFGPTAFPVSNPSTPSKTHL